MTAIVKLKIVPRKVSLLPVGHTAEIILFPGVRYERHAEPVAAKPKRKRKSRAKQARMVVVG